MSNMNPEMQTQFEFQRLQLIGSINHIVNNLREAAAAAEQMMNALSYGGQNPPPFPQLPNGQYAMPVMPPFPVAQDEHGKKRKSRGEDADGKKKAKKVKDPNAPKRPASSYLLFQNEVRSELKAKHPELRNNELLGAIAKLWSEMPQEQKDKYEQRNKAAKDQWLAHKAVYESGKAGANPVPVMAAPAVAAPIAASPVPVAAAPAAAATDSSEEEDDDDDEASSGSASSDEDTPPPPKKTKKEAAPTPAKEEGKKEKKHKKAKA